MKKFISTLFFLISMTPSALLAANDKTNTEVLPEIYCLYQTSSEESDHHHDDHDSHKKNHSEWMLWRTEKRIEIQDTRSSQGEIWTRLKSNKLEYSWLDHKQKFRVNYPSSDLKATNGDQLWKNKATLISPQLLSQLEKIEVTKSFGFTAEKYKGRVGNYQLEITWIPELSLPSKIIQQEDDKVTLTELKEVQTFKESKVKPFDSDDYEDMDFSDIGDNEAHPIARSHLYGMGLSAGEHKH